MASTLTIALYIFTLLQMPVRGTADYEDEYQSDPQSYDYSYTGGGGGDYEEEPQPTLIPQFTTEAQHFKVARDRMIRLPCRVDRLGPMVISWKKSDLEKGTVQYLATGTHRLTSDTRVSVEEANDHGSTLVISLAEEQDVGEYVCEVSSNPPATLRHRVSLIVPPSVSILKPQDDVYRIHGGEELALVCRGSGDPSPTLVWKRERKRMPDGHDSITGDQIIYKNVTRKHSGTYVCQGSNGSGFLARDTIKIDVQHTPEITGEQSYIQQSTEGIKLELVCVVHASPRATVTWYKDGLELVPSVRIVTEKLGRKYVLTVSDISELTDAGTYTCHATNSLGENKENFYVMVSTPTSEPRGSSSSQGNRDDHYRNRNPGRQTTLQSYQEGTMADDTLVEPRISGSMSLHQKTFATSSLLSLLLSVPILLLLLHIN